MVIHRSRCLASETTHNWVIISLGSLVRFWCRTSFLHATILWSLSLTRQRTLCIICHNMRITSPYYTGWCILSRTTAIPHMLHQGDACYLTDMEHFNTRHWGNEHKQSRKNVWCNANGVKDCKKTIITSFVSTLWKTLLNALKQSWKCRQLTCLINNCKLPKNFCLFGNT